MTFDPDISPETRLRLIHALRISPTEGGFLIEAEHRRLVIDNASLVTPVVLSGLWNWIAAPQLFAKAISAVGTEGGPQTQALLTRLEAAGLLVEGLWQDNTRIAELRVAPGSGLAPCPEPSIAAEALSLVEYCTMAPGPRGWTLSSPLASGVVIVPEPDILRHILNTPKDWIPKGDMQIGLAHMLRRAALMLPPEQLPEPGPLTSAGLRLHGLSRRGSAPGPVGAIGQSSPDRELDLPHPPHAAGTPVALPAPPQGESPKFAALLSRRNSLRRVRDENHLSADALGSLMGLAAKETTASGKHRHFPYPTAGSSPLFTSVLALSHPTDNLPALSAYDATTHALHPIAGDPEPLLQDAAVSMGVDKAPAGLVTLAAHFDRLGSKYGDTAYALVLKNSGVLLQTLHLAATASGLGSCILGGGDSRAFAKLTGYDPRHVGPVGEIALTGPLPDKLEKWERYDA
ncbi:SagB family peptide dehydrogenase [Primorskyibacter sp. S87]|uniref:SagB family peptide dehydrogenase n=1 Tax=Primorskyibacter sp. S87 TaxID=3415126 RepID=UPI003C79DA6F